MNQKNLFILIKLKNDTIYNEMLDSILKGDIKCYILDYFDAEDTIGSQFWQIDVIEVDLVNKKSKFEFKSQRFNNQNYCNGQNLIMFL